MKEITGFNIDTSNMSAVANVRQFIVQGDIGAVFSLQVKTSVNKYYDFVSRTFEGTAGVHEPNNRLANIKLTGGSYQGNIVFPVDADGETYTFLLWAEPHFNTRHASSLIGRSPDTPILDSNPVLYQNYIKQVADATVTFALATDTTSQFASFPSNVTNTKSPTKKAISVSDIDWTVATHSSDSGGFGIKLDAQPKDQSWYVTSQTTVDGTVSSSTTVVLDSVDNLAVGVTITAVSAGSLSGTPTITAIDLDTKKITMSGAQSFNDGITLTFRALGGALIKATQGVDLEFIDMTAALVQLTTTVRTDNSGDTVVDVNGTYGISAGATVRGVNIDNSSSNPLVAISASSTAGTITFTENQTVKAGTKLYIDGSGLQGTIKGKINIRKFPSSNVTVYFRADATFTQGAAS